MMNDEALKYYEKYLTGQYRPARLYFLLSSLPIIFFFILNIYCRFALGSWSYAPEIAKLTLLGAAAGVAIAWATEKASRVGSWALVENLETAFRDGHFREVWHALMIKYRGILPAVIASDRFRRLIAAVGAAIRQHEDLSPRQLEQINALIALSGAPSPRGDGLSRDRTNTKYYNAIIIAMWVSIVACAMARLANGLIINR